MRLLIHLILLSIIYSTKASEKLDESTNFITQILGSFHGKNSVNLTQFMSSFDIPSCLRRCMPPMDEINLMFSYDNNQKKATNSFCTNMMNSTKCATAAGCSDMFMDAMTNAFQFICIDNLDKISEQFQCIQEVTPDLQQECENTCAVQAGMIEKAAKNNVNELFSMENMCNSTACLAECYRDRLEYHCHFGDNNMLDNIFGNVLNGQKNGFEKIMEWMMPNDCKDENLKVYMPKKIEPITSMEINNTVHSESVMNSTDEYENSTDLYSEKNIFIDGKPHILRIQMLDANKRIIETPDVKSLIFLLDNKDHKENKEDYAKCNFSSYRSLPLIVILLVVNVFM